MRTPAPRSIRALATDYDGTIATHGEVDSGTIASLLRCRASGRSLILVTGRELDELRAVFPELEIFDLVVAENGPLLYWPKEQQERVLAPPPHPEFVKLLRTAKVEPLSVGRVVVATFEPHDRTVFEAIKTLGLELQVIFNKGSVMVLPSGINKASGLDAALAELGLKPEEVAGVGDAENDHAFLERCRISAAVANALPSIKEHVHFVAQQTHGAGVTEFIDWLLTADLPAGSDGQKK